MCKTSQFADFASERGSVIRNPVETDHFRLVVLRERGAHTSVPKKETDSNCGKNDRLDAVFSFLPTLRSDVSPEFTCLKALRLIS